MSAQAFEIRCPACGALVPPEAKGCTCGGPGAKLRLPVSGAPAGGVSASGLPAEPAAPEVPDVVNMRIKDYHRLVRSNYLAVEGPRVGVRPAPSRMRAYLPFVLLMLGLIVGAAMVLGKF